MVQMVQDRRGFPGSLKRDQERRAKQNYPLPVGGGQMARISEQMARIEGKLDALIEALADEGEEMDQPDLTLDGEAVGGERDDSQPL
ncbi:hypothetical protein [Achromobacter sp. ACM05]|uniref:hypothetical protein n=1 Tax=Achromobacter sp. ACM05 TaxID=2854776 RepID=UPI001C468839|nr:hypothetical protein [Achromobacter sp. ACM05]MBV7502087.1 hypothetical protein [Achromobacter sp. ACM05]